MSKIPKEIVDKIGVHTIYVKGEDWYEGDYYWETECKGKYLHMEFAI